MITPLRCITCHWYVWTPHTVLYICKIPSCKISCLMIAVQRETSSHNQNCSLSYGLSLYNKPALLLQHRALIRPVQINTTCIHLHRNCSLSISVSSCGISVPESLYFFCSKTALQRTQSTAKPLQHMAGLPLGRMRPLERIREEAI